MMGGMIAQIAAAATILIATGCNVGHVSGEGATGASPTAVRTAVVELSAKQEPAKYSTVIAPNAQVDLAFRVPGYVVELYQTRGADGRIRPLEAGARVAAGTTLAHIRASDYEALVDKALGARDEADAGMLAAAAQIAEAQAGLAEAELNFQRISKLWEQESVTKPVYDASKAKLDTAQAKVDAAKAASVGARQHLFSASGQLKEAQIALDDTQLRAPFSGVLLERRVELGTLVAAGTPAFIVADLHLVKGRFSVPDWALQSFRPGQSLELTVDAFPNESFLGRVLSLSAAADPRVRSFEIEVSIVNPGLKLRSGMIAVARAAGTTSDRHQVQIPVDALVHDAIADRYLVYTVEQKGSRAFAAATPVRPGPLSGNQVLILDGLNPGQRIVTSGANLLQPGEAIREVN